MAKRRPETRTQKMLRSDGALCLTFVNIGLGKRKAVESYADLLAWGVETGALDVAGAERLEQAATERPGMAGKVVRRATTLRARLERILAAVVDGRQPTVADVEAVNVELGPALGHRRLIATGGFRWSWSAASSEDDLDRVLWPVLLSAGELLTSPDRGRIRRCPNKGCGLMFVARGGGRPRKWCGRVCRDRGTSRRHYQRVIKPKREKLASEKPAREEALAAEVAARMRLDTPDDGS